MLLTVRGRFTALDVETRTLTAKFITASPSTNVHHAVHSLLTAKHRRLAAIDTKGRKPCAAIMRTTPVADVDHVILGMLSAISCLHTFEVERRLPHAGVM